VTKTLTFPAACPGVVKLREVEEFTVTDPAGMVLEPMVTVVLPAIKLVPVMVTKVPPPIGPKAGLNEVAVAAELL
jgi:hypothetical protein